MEILTSIIVHHTNPHHAGLLSAQPQRIIHQPLGIEMPPPTRIRGSHLDPLDNLLGTPALDRETDDGYSQLLGG